MCVSCGYECMCINVDLCVCLVGMNVCALMQICVCVSCGYECMCINADLCVCVLWV